MKPLPIRRRLAAALALTLLGLGACEGRADVVIVGMKTGVGRERYLQLRDSVRLESEKEDASRGEAQGVTVEVVVKLDGYKGEKVPLDYTLHDARNSLPFVSRRVAMQPDAPEWSRRGQVWLPVPAAGTYYVQFVLGDSTGHKPIGSRTQEFTVP
jgi:hypothetical protein